MMKHAKPILAWAATILTGFSLLFSLGQISSHTLNRKGTPLHALSYQFQELKPLFNGLEFAGYYTDKDINNSIVIAQYEQAQFVLSPTVLVLNNAKYPLVIFDCANPQTALAKIQEYGLKPLRASPTGLILAIDPKAVGQ